MENVEQLHDVDFVGTSTANQYFDTVIGHIEDIIISDSFVTLHKHFMESHWKIFENMEENKLEYMNIFQSYTQTFESFFMAEISRRMSNFDMHRFAEYLDENEAFHDTLNYGEIYELLHSFSSFEIFKELMLNYRSKKEGHMQHLNFNILSTKPIRKI